ncbi:UNVERIFIED_CONTAM: hypothetical protein Sradi_0542000 [Sesamum radiatum]|uniref:Uncharacterized protein n=1 Tax=Sesamum radiatum TaxID=300843 RepID=A0AAW2VII1_SESRA
MKNCSKLRFISEVNIAFPQLQEVEVHNCPLLNRLPLTPHNVGTIKKIEGERKWWDELQWENDDFKKLYTPARVENKVKVFVWRARLNALPTGANLKRMVGSRPCVPSAKTPLKSLTYLGGLVMLGADLGCSIKQGVLSWMQAVASQFPVGLHKAYFDGAVFVAEGEMGVGVVARDSQGQCVAWMAPVSDSCRGWEIRGSLGCYRAIQLAIRKG